MTFVSKLLKVDINKLKANQNIKGLINELNRNNPKTFNDVINALDEIGDTTFVNPFIKILRNLYNDFHRQDSGTYIGMSLEQAQAHAKEKAEKYKQDIVRPLWALKIIGDSTSIEPFLKEVKKVIREQEREGPGWRSIQRTTEEWKRIREIWQRPSWALEIVGKSAVPQIIETIQNKEESNDVRNCMILIMGLRKDPTAIESLIQIASDEMESSKVRKRAVDSLKYFDKNPKVKKCLKSFTNIMGEIIFK